MARIRSIKPEFWRHPVLSRLPVRTQLLGAALVSMADNYGIFLADPREIRGQVLPNFDSLNKIRSMTDALCRTDFIQVVQHPEQGLVGRITKWSLHQKVDHPGKTKLGHYFWSDKAVSIPASVESFSRIPRECFRPAPDCFAPDQGSGIRDQGTGNREGITSSPSRNFVFPTEEEMKAAGAAYPGSLARGTPPMIPVWFLMELLEWGRENPEKWPGNKWQTWIGERWEKKVQERGLAALQKKAPPDFEKHRAPGDLDAWWTDPVDLVSGRIAGASLRGDSVTADRLREIVKIRGGTL